MPAPDGPQFKFFHGTNMPSDEVMKAPSIHAGTKDAAFARLHDIGYASYYQAILELTPSEHLERHPVTLSDDEANAADARYLKKANYLVPRSVSQSATSRDDMDYQTARRIVGAARALARNQMVTYHNNFESGLSVIIPSPHHNAALTDVTNSDKLVSGKTAKSTRNKAKDPHTQTPLPMDYSTLQVSKRTSNYKKGIDEYADDYDDDSFDPSKTANTALVTSMSKGPKKRSTRFNALDEPGYEQLKLDGM